MKSIITYNQNRSIDTMASTHLDNYPRRLKDNWIWRVNCNPDTIVETWVELSNKGFDEELNNYILHPVEKIQYNEALNLAKLDTIGFSKALLNQPSFHQTDTIHGKVNHSLTEPTLIFDPNGKLLREFPVPPDFQPHIYQFRFIDYIYNDNGQLAKKEWVGYEFFKSEYFFFNKNGLISSIWVEDKDSFTLKKVFIYKLKAE